MIEMPNYAPESPEDDEYIPWDCDNGLPEGLGNEEE